MGTLDSQSPENALEPPGDSPQEDARGTSRSPDKVLALRTWVAQLEGDLAVAHARIQDLTEINSLLCLNTPNPAPARVNENGEPPHPPELPPPPESRQSSLPPPGHSRLSSPALVTCLGESLLAGVGHNKSYTDAPVFDGTDRELYKDWKRAVLRKLKMSAWLYPTPESGIM